MDAAGVDDVGNTYQSPTELWHTIKKGQSTSHPSSDDQRKESSSRILRSRHHHPQPHNDRDEEDEDVATTSTTGRAPTWYSDAVAYWDAQEATDDGVLGGHGHLSGVDVRDSEAFLLKVMGSRLGATNANERDSVDMGRGEKKTFVALDCGAGVGRVSACLLLRHFHEVDLVEPSAHLLATAKKRLCGKRASTSREAELWPADHRAVGFFQCGLESFHPEPGRYDVIWIQWALLYLTDEDAVAFLQRCAAALRPGGFIFLKENVCPKGFIVDSEDASVTRSHAYLTELTTKMAGLSLVSTARQQNFPKPLFPVRMYALARKA